MKKLIIVLVLVASCYGCKKDESVIYSSSLIGEWSWISTCGLAETDCQTPVSTHTSRKIILTSDSLFYFYQNDTLTISSRFHTNGSNFSGGYIIYDYDSGFPDRFSISHDTLALSNVYGFITWVNRYKFSKQ